MIIGYLVSRKSRNLTKIGKELGHLLISYIKITHQGWDTYGTTINDLGEARRKSRKKKFSKPFSRKKKKFTGASSRKKKTEKGLPRGKKLKKAFAGKK